MIKNLSSYLWKNNILQNDSSCHTRSVGLWAQLIVNEARGKEAVQISMYPDGRPRIIDACQVKDKDLHCEIEAMLFF